MESSAATISVNVGNVTATLDSDGDGIPDLVEYALGLSPDFPSEDRKPATAIEVFSGKSYQTLTATRSITPPDAPLSIQVSADQRTWTTATTVTNIPEMLKARDTTPWSSAKPRAIRLQVKRP